MGELKPEDISYWFCMGIAFSTALKLEHWKESYDIQDEYLATQNAKSRARRPG